MAHPEKPWRRTGLTIAVLVLVPGLALAQDEFCEPIPVPDVARCSNAAMLDALNEDQLIAGPRSPSDIFAEGRTPPGQGELTVSGLVGETGSVCAQPVSALTTDGLILSGALSNLSPEELLDNVDSADKIGMIMDFMSRMASSDQPATSFDADMLGVLIPDDAADRNVIFELSSPNAFTLEMGILGNPIWIEHSGATGWSPRSASHFVIQLPRTTADDLEPGGEYRAVAQAPYDQEPNTLPTVMGFYTTWDGQFETVVDPDRRAPAMALPLLRDLQQNLEIPEGMQGLDLARMAAAGEGQAFAGEVTVVGGQLDGTVTIEEVTDDSVLGRIELSGDGWVETDTREFTYDDDGALDGSERVDLSRRDGPLSVQGRFEAPNQGRMTHLGHSAVAIDARGGQRAPTLSVEAHFPQTGAKNLDFDDPRLEIVFDRALDPQSVGPDTAHIEYPNATGAMTEIGTSVRLDDDTLHISPTRSLEPAAWYRLVINGGSAGPAGRDGATLSGSFGLTFATVPDEFEIAPSIFQVARDAPLVAGKTTLTRLYVDWERPENTVHDSWHVRDIPADAWATDEREGLLYTKKEDVPVPNEDLATPGQEREANNTVNFFGWEPALRETREVIGFIEPLDPCDQPLGEEEGNRAVTWTDLQRDLTFDYYMMRVGPWADGVPDNVRSLLRTVAANAARFTQQTFPVTGVSGRYAGDYTPTQGWQQRYGDDLPDSYAGGAEVMLMSELHDNVVQFSDADLILAFIPTEVTQGGAAYGPVPLAEGGNEFRWSQPVRFRTPVAAMQAVARAGQKPAITHEFAHGFGLQHVPDVANIGERQAECDSGRTEMAGIEGFRLSLNGTGGTNKSYEEGNGETTWGLLPLMYPCAEEYSKHFILRDHYLQLIDAIGTHTRTGNAAPTIETPAEAPAHSPPSYAMVLESLLAGGPAWAADQDGAFSGGGQYVVKGRLGDTPDVTRIEAMAPALRRFQDTGPNGPFTLRAYDRDDTVLAERAVGADLSADGGNPFFTIIEAAQPPYRLELRRGDTVMAERTRSPHPPEINEFSVDDVDGDLARLSWQTEDGGGDTLTFTVLFRPGEDEGWRVVAVREGETTAAIHRSALPMGPDPRFRLIASDGMDQTTADIPAAEATREPLPLSAADDLETEAETETETALQPDPGPPRLGGGLSDPEPSDPPPSPAPSTDPTDGGSQDGGPQDGEAGAQAGAETDDTPVADGGTVTVGDESHDFSIEDCERTTAGPDMRIVNILGETAPEGEARLVVSASMADLPDGGNQVVELRRVNADGSEGAVYVAMRTKQGDDWQTGFGDPADGPLLTIDGTTVSGSGEFFDRTGQPESMGTGRFDAHCASLGED